MSMDDRTDRSARARARMQCADEILANLSLLSRWHAVGEPVVVGSVALDVVVRPDIDIEVYADELSPTAGFDVMVPLSELQHVRRIPAVHRADPCRHRRGWRCP